MPELEQFAEQPKPPEQEADTKTPGSINVPKNKKIFVFCDGTGNEFAGMDPIQNPKNDGNSNVVKLYTSLRLDVNQVAYYHPGVGTMGDPSKKGIARQWSKIKGLAFGRGFQENVLDAYRYLMQHYSWGDTVYIVGFSRGAYTARALAGLLHGYGLLCRGNEGHLLYAWQMYINELEKARKALQKSGKARKNPQSPSTEESLHEVREENKDGHTIKTDTTFRDTFSHPDFIIHFMGLWDTVSSVGWITTPVRLLHLAQNSSVVIGRHAISIGERRCFYHDNLWGDPVPVQVPPVLKGSPRGDALSGNQDILQVWFPGVHSDVGGSYPQLQSGLANNSLKWMMDQIQAAGAVFDPARKSAVLGGEVLDDDRRLTAALRLLYPEPTSDKIHPSMTGWWWILEAFPHRFYDKEEDAEELRIPWGGWRHLPKGAILHPSVLALKEAGYVPPNLATGTISDDPLDASASVNLTGYGQFHPPLNPPWEWRENPALVLLVKGLLLSIPLFVFHVPILAVLRWVAGWIGLAGGFFADHDWLPQQGWPERLLLEAQHLVIVWVWALVAAAALIVCWELYRKARPRA